MCSLRLLFKIPFQLTDFCPVVEVGVGKIGWELGGGEKVEKIVLET